MNNINNVKNGGGFKRNLGPISWSLLASCAYSLATFFLLSENTKLGLDIVFENEWEATSDWNEGDVVVEVEEEEEM